MFKDLLPVLFSHHLSYKTRGHVDSTFVRSAILHASERWHWPPLTKPNLHHLQCNDRAMIRQICNVRPEDVATSRSNELLTLFGNEDLDLILRERKLHWHGHMERLRGGNKTAWYVDVPGSRGADDMEAGDREGLERLCHYLEGGPLIWTLPQHLSVNQNTKDEEEDDDEVPNNC